MALLTNNEKIIKILKNEAREASLMSTSSHRVHTPIGLVREMLSNIDEVYLHCGDILVLFNIEFLLELRELGVDMNGVTYYTDDDFKGKAAAKIGVKVITELPMNKKFDVVLLNPPYSNDTQKDLYMEYVRLAMGLSNYATAIITPSRWTSLNNATFKKFNNELLDNGLSYFKWNDAKTFDVQMPTCSYVLDKDNTSNTVTVINEDNDTASVDINKIGFYPADFDALSVLDKVAGLPGLKIKSGGLYESGLVAGSNKIVLRAGTKGEALPYFMGDDSSAAKTSLRGESKVVFSRNTAEFKIGEVKIADKDAGVGFGAFGIVTNNDAEGDNLIGYLNSNLVKFLVRNYKKGTKGNSIELFSKIPAMDFTRSWSDADVYSHFGLTDADIEYIEANI